MSKDYLWDYDSTAANNTDRGGVNIAEGCNFGGMNDAHRVGMKHIADWLAADTLASASASSMATTAATCVNITGTTTITSFGTLKAGVWKFVRFAAALTLTHNGTSFILPGGANITTAAGDTALFISEGSGNWRCHSYVRGASAPFGLLDEDDMASDSATSAPSQQSVKAYAQPLAALLTDISGLTVAEGDILYVNGSGDIVNLGAGSDGEVLTLASGVPSWAAATGGIGTSQTWQDVSGSRSVSTSYQNTTGKPIMVNVVDPTDGSNGNLQVSTDNSTWVTVSNTVDFGQASAIVPDTHYYRLTAGNISVWSELR